MLYVDLVLEMISLASQIRSIHNVITDTFN